MRPKNLLNGSARLYPALRWFWVVVGGLVLAYVGSFLWAITTGGAWELTIRTREFLSRFGGAIALFFVALAFLTFQAWSSSRRQIDPNLIAAAKIVQSSDVQVGTDIVVQGFRPD